MARETKDAVKAHIGELSELAESSPFTVFLCGPTLDPKTPKSSARLRKKLINELLEDGFDVVLGEDDGLEEERIRIGLNAQDNELEFVSRQCNAIILIADSVGSFCELGLFSWHFVHREGRIQGELTPTFVVLVNENFQGDKSYLNEGPVGSLDGFGDVLFVNYDDFDTKTILKKLRNVRSIKLIDRRGRPGNST